MKETRIRLQNALKNEDVEKMFHTDLMNIFKELGLFFPDECKILTNEILLDLKNTTKLESFEKRCHLIFKNYKVLGKDLLKVISEKNDHYNEALFFEIKESMKPDLKERFSKSTYGFISEGGIHSDGKLNCVFAVDVLSHCVDLNKSLEDVTNLANKRIVIVETVPFYTKIRETEANDDRTFLNDYFYHRIFCRKTSVPFVGNYKTSHNWDVLIAQKGFEVKSSLSKTFDFNHSLISEEKRPIVKTKHYIGVYEKASDAITVGCK